MGDMGEVVRSTCRLAGVIGNVAKDGSDGAGEVDSLGAADGTRWRE